MKPIATILILVALAACGADGAPIRPSLNTALTISNGGVQINNSVSLRKGRVTVTADL